MESELSRFRILLAVGATLTAVYGLLGWFAPNTLRGIVGLDIPPDTEGLPAMARLYGGLSISAAIGYAIAAADPARQRGLLVVLFSVPASAVLASIVGVTGEEYSALPGVLFGVVNLVYLLLFVRWYPRPVETPPAAGPGDPPDAA